MHPYDRDFGEVVTTVIADGWEGEFEARWSALITPPPPSSCWPEWMCALLALLLILAR